jgi:hypothetical protein
MSVRSSLRWPRLAVGLVALGVGLAVAPTAVAVAAPHAEHGPAMASQTPAPVRDGSARRVGAYDPAQTLRLAVGLRPPHMAAEQQFLRQVQDKSSPLFHRFLTPSAWTARFGPSAAA